MLTFWLACARQGDRPAEAITDSSTAPTCSTSTLAMPPGAEPWMTVDPGFRFAWFDIADLDGDGTTDAVVTLYQEDLPTTGIVYGPLRGTTVPGDFAATFSTFDGFYETPIAVGEFTGSPPVDVILDAAGDRYVVPGPWGGATTPQEDWIPYTGDATTWYDIDRDGALDELELSPPEGPASLEITWGPASRFDGPTDVQIGLCRGPGTTSGYTVRDVVQVNGDLDGNGTPELSARAFGRSDGDDCGDFTVSVPESGAIDPFVPAQGVWDGLTTSAVPIGDWNGDGQGDLLEGNPGDWGWGTDPVPAILLSPLALGSDGIEAGTSIPISGGTTVLPFDLDGDGRAELTTWLRDEDDPCATELAVIPSNMEAAVAGDWRRLDVTSALGAIGEDGHAWLLTSDATTLGAIDLGAATPL